MENSPKILAIDPGTREIGVAVFDDTNLLYYAVKTIRDRSTAQKILQEAARLTRELIGAYQPSCFAIEKMFIVQKSAALLSVLAEEMKRVAKEQGMTVLEYSPTAIRKVLCDSGKATKREVAKLVAGRYRELNRFLNAQTKWEEKYYANIFDAVAVGLRARMELINQQLPF